MTAHDPTRPAAAGGHRRQGGGTVLADLPRPVAGVFGAGIARAAAQVGMLRELGAVGVHFDLTVGSSWGAVNAAAMKAWRTEGSGPMERFWQDLAHDRSWTSRFRGVIRALTPKRSEASADLLREHLVALLGESRLEDASPRVCCVATDIVAGLPVELSTGSAVDAVMAAAAVPLLLPPVASGGQILVDGGAAAPVGVRQAIAMGAKSIIVLDVGACDMSVEAAMELRWYEVGIAAYSDMLRAQARADLAQVAGRAPVVVISLPPGDLINFKDADSLIAQGETAARVTLGSLSHAKWAPGLYGLPDGTDDGAGHGGGRT